MKFEKGKWYKTSGGNQCNFLRAEEDSEDIIHYYQFLQWRGDKGYSYGTLSAYSKSNPNKWSSMPEDSPVPMEEVTKFLPKDHEDLKPKQLNYEFF